MFSTANGTIPVHEKVIENRSGNVNVRNPQQYKTHRKSTFSTGIIVIITCSLLSNVCMTQVMMEQNADNKMLIVCSGSSQSTRFIESK